MEEVTEQETLAKMEDYIHAVSTEATHADRKLTDAINETNIIVMAMAWIALPTYRKYLSGPLEDRCRKLFIVPFQSLIHALQWNKQGHETVQERRKD
jgi:hypothetical protein